MIWGVVPLMMINVATYRWESVFWTHQQKTILREFRFFIAQFKTKTLTVKLFPPLFSGKPVTVSSFATKQVFWILWFKLRRPYILNKLNIDTQHSHMWKEKYVHYVHVPKHRLFTNSILPSDYPWEFNPEGFTSQVCPTAESRLQVILQFPIVSCGIRIHPLKSNPLIRAN